MRCCRLLLPGAPLCLCRVVAGWPGQGITRIDPWPDACQEKHEKFLVCFCSRDFTHESYNRKA